MVLSVQREVIRCAQTRGLLPTDRATAHSPYRWRCGMDLNWRTLVKDNKTLGVSGNRDINKFVISPLVPNRLAQRQADDVCGRNAGASTYLQDVLFLMAGDPIFIYLALFLVGQLCV
jgi:hypothetical protein